MQITKLQAAEHQLNVAIRLFLTGDYLSSLTLAGAAEEILGKLSERSNKPVAIKSIIDALVEHTDPLLPEIKRRAVIMKLANSARNQAKHATDETETHISVERIHPLQMIMRALPMAERFGIPFAGEIQAMCVWIRDHPEACS